jgi:nitronate monooxygenase
LLEKLRNIIISGKECLPIIEGGKGIGLSTGLTAGTFASCGAVGTFSGVNPNAVDDNGVIIPMLLKAKTRLERHLEMIEYSVRGILSQAKIARDISNGKGRIHMNVLWEMGGTEKILNEALAKAKGLINGIVCGAGMPYKLGEIASKYKVYYYPIVSSMRAFRALWLRSYKKTKEWLGAVVYECPWRAGGHNGLSNSEDPFVPGNSYERVVELRKFMNTVGLNNTPIIVAGGVWNIEEYKDWLDNPAIGQVAFQFGTRPLLTKESPVSDYEKQKLANLKENDIKTNPFSPTGFWSSAINNDLLKELYARNERQVEYKDKIEDKFDTKIICGKSQKEYFIKKEDEVKVNKWINNGYTESAKTPDNTLIFITAEKLNQFKQDLKDCHGCLSQCRFSCWSQHTENNNSGKLPDFRSYCIQKSLQDTKKGINIKNQLWFAGNNVFRFATDPFYKNGFVPTIKQLVNKLLEGE